MEAKVRTSIEELVVALYRDICGVLPASRAATIPASVVLYISIVKNNIRADHPAEKALYELLEAMRGVLPPREAGVHRIPSGLGMRRLTLSEGAPRPQMLQLSARATQRLHWEAEAVLRLGGVGEELHRSLCALAQICKKLLPNLLRHEAHQNIQLELPRLLEQTAVLLITEKLSVAEVYEWVGHDIYKGKFSLAQLSELMYAVSGTAVRFSRRALESNVALLRDLHQWVAFMRRMDLEDSSVTKELETLLLY